MEAIWSSFVEGYVDVEFYRESAALNETRQLFNMSVFSSQKPKEPPFYKLRPP